MCDLLVFVALAWRCLCIGRLWRNRFRVGSVFLDVFNDERDTAICGIVGLLPCSRLLIGEPPHLRNLPCGKSTGTHDAARGVRTIDREFPIAVSRKAT